MGAWRNPTKIWCKRADRREPFHTTTRNVGSERFFYEFKELTTDDLAYVEQIISKSSDQRLRELNRGWVRNFQHTFVLRRRLLSQELNTRTRNEFETQLSAAEKMLGETFHAKIEGRAIPMLDELRGGDSRFVNDPNQCSDFVFYLSLQYFRTAKMRNLMHRIQHSLPHDMRRTWPIESFIYATNVGASLYGQRLDYRVVFLRNCSNVSFITGDQPVINLRGIADEALDFYYPLSPSLAMIYTADNELYPCETIEASLFTVEGYNYQIYSRSENQIFGNDPEYLKELSKLQKFP